MAHGCGHRGHPPSSRHPEDAEPRRLQLQGTGRRLSVEKASEAAAALGAAAKSKGGDTASPSQVAAAISGASRSRLSGMRPYHILWVDDHPENNEYEAQAMSALGFRVDIARSTKEAMGRIRDDSYDLVISDLGRQSAG